MSKYGPTDGELRAAGVELRIARLNADMEAMLSATWRGRVALRIVRWRTARRRR